MEFMDQLLNLWVVWSNCTSKDCWPGLKLITNGNLVEFVRKVGWKRKWDWKWRICSRPIVSYWPDMCSHFSFCSLNLGSTRLHDTHRQGIEWSRKELYLWTPSFNNCRSRRYNNCQVNYVVQGSKDGSFSVLNLKVLRETNDQIAHSTYAKSSKH